MATYTPITKTLTKAVPIKRVEDNFVVRWEIEVDYAYAGDGAELPAWTTTYSHSIEISEPSKVATDYTKAELVASMPPVLEEHVFHAHYEAFNIVQPVTEEEDQEFTLDNLGE